MLDSIRKFTDFDMIFFTPHEEDEDSTEVRAATYKDNAEKVGGSEMGDNYHIVLFRMDEEDVIIDLEQFEGILIDPRVYVSRMVDNNFYGLVAKKTTTSEVFVADVFDSWAKL
jgi:hypothetical protein